MAPAKRSWDQVSLAAPAEAADAVMDLCFEVGSCGLQSQESDDAILITAYFERSPGSPSLPRLRALLTERGCGALLKHTEEVVERNWNLEWRSFYEPVWASERIVVHPPWIDVETRGDQIAIAIEPGMAFGTGGHESTQLCLQALTAVSPASRCCLDVGTGTGILAIAAIELGARSVVALDIDAQAVECARANVIAAFGDQAEAVVSNGSLDGLGEESSFDLIMANLESRYLQPLLHRMRSLLRDEGSILFSGLLSREHAEFEGWLGDVGLSIDRTWTKNEWMSCSVLAQGPLSRATVF